MNIFQYEYSVNIPLNMNEFVMNVLYLELHFLTSNDLRMYVDMP